MKSGTICETLLESGRRDGVKAAEAVEKLKFLLQIPIKGCLALPQLMLWDRESQMTELDGNHKSPLRATKTGDL